MLSLCLQKLYLLLQSYTDFLQQQAAREGLAVNIYLLFTVAFRAEHAVLPPHGARGSPGLTALSKRGQTVTEQPTSWRPI